MFGRVSVFGRVAISRIVAAKCHSALLTGAKVDPGVADFHTLGTFANFGLLDGIDGVEVRAGAITHLRLLLFEAVNRRWIPAIAIPPSPTAAAQRLTDPDRTSPAAKIPGRLVSIGDG